MEFLDEETRPRFLFQSRVTSVPSTEPETQTINKPIAFICVSISLLFSLFSIFFLQSETLRFLILWFSLSLLVGPFAPITITGGDIRVGQGDILDEQSDFDQTVQIDEPKKRLPNRRQKSRRSEDSLPPLDSNSMGVIDDGVRNSRLDLVCNGDKDLILEQKEWTDEDFDLLKKQILKHPVGTLKRWELIGEAFKGRHGTDSVIETAKSLSEKKPRDSFSQFLKQRKPLDKRMEDGNWEMIDNGEVKKESGVGDSSNWSSGEDIALLTALKAFPKDVAMRWEKITAAVPGKPKACCMKRVAELKKGFRSSKATAE